MIWLTNFLTHIRRIRDNNFQVNILMRLALEYCNELYFHLGGYEPGNNHGQFTFFRALLSLWIAVLHTEYQAFMTLWSVETGRAYGPEMCTCAVCEGRFRAPYMMDRLWQLLRDADIQCDCPGCLHEPLPGQYQGAAETPEQPGYHPPQQYQHPRSPQVSPPPQRPNSPSPQRPPQSPQQAPQSPQQAPQSPQQPPQDPRSPTRRAVPFRRRQRWRGAAPYVVPRYQVVLLPNGLRAVFRRERNEH